MYDELKEVMGFMFGILLIIGIMILINPLVWLLADWIMRVDSNILGIGLVVIGIIGKYLTFKK